MFLFKNTKSIIKRIGMNLVIYGLADTALAMMLALLLPQTMAGVVSILTVIGSICFILGCLLSVVGFLREITICITTSAQAPLLHNQANNEALLLFHLYQDDVVSHRFFLTSKKTILMEEIHQEPVTLSFKKFNQIIATCNNPQAKRYQGINKKNCFRLAAQALYLPSETGYTAGTAEERLHHQQQALAASDLVFTDSSTRYDQMPDYAIPYDTFIQQIKKRFELEQMRGLESRYIAYHEADNAYYEVYDRTIGQCKQSHLSGWVRLFDPGKSQPLRRLSLQEVRDLLHKHRYETILYYRGSSGYEYHKLSLRFRMDGAIVLAEERCFGYKDGGGIEKELDTAFFADKSTDDFISFLHHKYKLNFEDLYTKKSPDRLLAIIKQTHKPEAK